MAQSEIGASHVASHVTMGAQYLGKGRCLFKVWAPAARSVEVEIYRPSPRVARLERISNGYWSSVVEDLEPGALYKYRLDESQAFPDPASRWQPDGVHEASAIVADDFRWTDRGWHGRAIEDYILYELHVGTFTEAGSFDSAISHLPYLKGLGITAVEVMPVAQFPGARNWGYDGAFPFAVQNTYGGPEGFKRFIDAAHGHGLAVLLDVVYNHLGPEGNYLGQFGPYFTDRYQTPWGQAINFDGPDAEGVREYFLQNALYWVREFHIDGLRLDAVHAIFDRSSNHILSEIAERVHDFAQDQERTVTVVGESDLNEARIVRAGEMGGYGLDAQWSDDFHHALHTVLTGEQSGYYEDFGRVEDVAKALSSGFVYSGQYSKHRGRHHGTESSDLPGRAFVVCVQNHDQIGNRMLGERLSHLVSFDDLKLAAGILLLAPYVPLLFMGQEYAEAAPFLYFVSHSDTALTHAVREGRKREFESFSWMGEVPDAQDESTFLRSKLNPVLRSSGQHAVLLDWYRKLIDLRTSNEALRALNRKAVGVDVAGSGYTITMRRWSQEQEVLAVYHLGSSAESIELNARQRTWVKALDSSESRWLGQGSNVPEMLNVERDQLVLPLQPRQCVVLCATSHGEHPV